MRSRRVRRRLQGAVQDISLTPLIDTALTLLIVFMVATPMMQNAIKITLPKTKASEDVQAQQELVVYIDEKGELYLNKTKYKVPQLLEEIKKMVGKAKDQTVFVKADTAVSYGNVIKMVDDIKVIGGVQYVALATTKAA